MLIHIFPANKTFFFIRVLDFFFLIVAPDFFRAYGGFISDIRQTQLEFLHPLDLYIELSRDTITVLSFFDFSSGR